MNAYFEIERQKLELEKRRLEIRKEQSTDPCDKNDKFIGKNKISIKLPKFEGELNFGNFKVWKDSWNDYYKLSQLGDSQGAKNFGT